MRRRDIVAGLVALLVAAVCARLGIWQLERLGQRRARNGAAAARLALPPVVISGRAIALDSIRQRRVEARGVFDYEREQTWPGRSFQGTPGVALITPLRLRDGSEVFVDRGWAPSADAYHIDHQAYQERDTVTVAGLGLEAPRGRGDVKPGGDFLPFVIQMEAPQPPGVRGLPRRWPRPVLDDGPHLSYAVQWFSFAAIILVGTAVLLRSRK